MVTHALETAGWLLVPDVREALATKQVLKLSEFS